MRVSIRSILVIGFTSLLAVSLVIVMGVGVYGTLDNTFNLLTRESARMVEEAERRLEQELSPIESQGEFIARQFETGVYSFDNPERLFFALQATTAAIPDLAGLLIVSTDGKGYRVLGETRLSSFPVTAIELYRPGDDRFQTIELAREAGGPVWRQPFWVEELGQPLINYHVPLHKDGEMIGVLILGKSVPELSSQLLSLQEGYSQVPFLLYDRKYVLAHSRMRAQGFTPDWNAQEDADRIPLPEVASFSDIVLAKFPRRIPLNLGQYANRDGVEIARIEIADTNFIVSYRDVDGVAADKPITIGIYVDESFYDTLRDRLQHMILVGVIVCVVAIGLALFLARATTRPILALAEASRYVANGDLKDIPRLPKSHMKELDEAGIAFGGMVEGLRERAVIADLFGRVMPHKIAEQMLKSPEGLAPQVLEATVLFCDMAEFTHMTEDLGPEKVVRVLNTYFTDLVDIIHRYDGIVTQFQGDAILAVFNVPLPDPDHAEKAVKAAREIRNHLTLRSYEGQWIKNRIGIATGPLIAANVGAESRMNYTVHGDTVNLAARLEQLNKDLGEEILIAESTVDLIQGFDVQDKGTFKVRGRDAPIHVFSVD